MSASRRFMAGGGFLFFKQSASLFSVETLCRRVSANILRVASLVLIFVGTALQCAAHDPGLSSANLTVGPTAVTVELSFAPADVESIGFSADPAPAASTVEWQTGGQAVPPSEAGLWRRVEDNAELRLVFPRGSAESATFRSALISQLPFGHRQLLTVRDSAGVLLDSRLLSAQQSTAEIPLPAIGAVAAEPVSQQPTFLGFVLLGIEHILIGYDHLLFLFALLLVCDRFGSAVTLITCFTVAHSITLALATFDLVSLPSRLVESLIAASIIYVGAENLFATRPIRWRWVLTFSFGLIHGLGFASVLRELGVGEGSGSVILPLFSFNLGVELGQIAIAAVMLPILLLLRRKPAFVRIGIPAASMLLVCAGAYWLIERTVL